jgi:hypothetical protein
MTAALEEITSLIQEVKRFEQLFFEKSGIKIIFEDRAVDSLLKRSLEEETPLEVLCSSLFKSYHHGLKLVQEKNGMHQFVLNREALDDPEGYLDRLIKQSYSG